MSTNVSSPARSEDPVWPSERQPSRPWTEVSTSGGALGADARHRPPYCLGDPLKPHKSTAQTPRPAIHAYALFFGLVVSLPVRLTAPFAFLSASRCFLFRFRVSVHRVLGRGWWRDRRRGGESKVLGQQQRGVQAARCERRDCGSRLAGGPPFSWARQQAVRNSSTFLLEADRRQPHSAHAPRTGSPVRHPCHRSLFRQRTAYGSLCLRIGVRPLPPLPGERNSTDTAPDPATQRT